MNLFYGVALILTLQAMAWVGANGQFSEYFKSYNTLLICVALAIPISICGYFGSRFLYAHFSSAWSIRFIGFGLSYLVFPFMTWFLLGETMFTLKTAICIFLSFCIILIQVLM
tara:strand:- start:51396 stop:51734 length:339 start_codon:yes stop_codon:yes gene_type:complete